MSHELIIREEHYEKIRIGSQRALYRADAVDVEVDDTLRLVECFEESGTYTGRWLAVRVTHMERVTQRQHGAVAYKQIVSIELKDSGSGNSYVLTVEGSKREVVAA